MSDGDPNRVSRTLLDEHGPPKAWQHGGNKPGQWNFGAALMRAE